MEPRFSVIIPSFNREATLGRAIESVLHQTYPAIEIMIVDDGSMDQTRQVVEAFPQVTHFYQENKGVSAARNQGAEIATGDWLIFLDSDDELFPSALEKFANKIEKYPGKLVFTGGFFLLNGETKKEFIPSQGKYIGQISGSFVIQRKLFLELGGYDSRLKFAENTELFFRIEWAGHSPLLVQSPIMYYYQNSNGGNNNPKNVTESIQWILEKHQQRLPNPIKRLYHQILGVNFLRSRMFSEARNHLFHAYMLDMKRLDTLGRLFISCLPLLARRLYSENPRS